MILPDLTPQQAQLAQIPSGTRRFLEGPPGSGKTTIGLAHLHTLLQQSVPAQTILVLSPQRTLALPYTQLLRHPNLPPGGQVSVVTLGGLAQRLIALFWPTIAAQAGFATPTQPPIFLTLETAQYYLARIMQPLLEQGYFESLTIDRHRLYSQILDNLNKAAGVGFPVETIAERLSAAWIGKAGQEMLYQQAQECALLFRQFCLENNLLDFSLQLQTFIEHLWPSFLCRSYLTATYRHLIYDNVEEDVPVVHDVLRAWLPAFDSALLIYDSEGGYRAFLGADPISAHALEQECTDTAHLEENFIAPAPVQHLAEAFCSALLHRPMPKQTDLATAFSMQHERFAPQMVEWVCQKTAEYVQAGMPPGEIAILSPFLSDSLRFSLMNRLDELNVPNRSHRPSRSLREEPTTRCLLTFSLLAHPQWKMDCPTEDVRSALLQTIEGLDLVRADLLSQVLYKGRTTSLGSFDTLVSTMQQRITYAIGERFEQLSTWLTLYRSGDVQELDVFLSRLFGELLSQPGFGFHTRYDAAAITARLIESVQKFRRVAAPSLQTEGTPLGQAYLQMVQDGILAAQYLHSWEDEESDTVLLAPAHTFLMSNRPVSVQFWLNAGSQGWWERLYQPLTHPVVLSRRWTEGRRWSDADEFHTNQSSLSRLVTGLLLRCRSHVHLCINSLNESGEEERGALLLALQTIRRNLAAIRS